ncbi:bromodomain-containing protein 8-like [Palaemon carinicauda]|uniref:bromodomain-containing protein 8-like n=1 Tax=Palaemon carinicauda TaxID=392227 RepID=UPI0035B59A0B
MATSLQERLKLKQYQVDTWTTREQLCLASAVLRSGDQNWVAVRRNIKMLTTEHSRPPDWYSTKNCALQYAKLLECVDTPKRKRERSDSTNETPGEVVTKMLTKQLPYIESLIICKKKGEVEEGNDYQEKSIKNFLQEQYQGLGPVSQHEIVVFLSFTVLVFLWVFRDPGFMHGWAYYISSSFDNEVHIRDATPVMLMVFILFCVPRSFRRDNSGSSSQPDMAEGCLTWKVVHERTPWGIILLLGGGLAMAEAAKVSGLSAWLGYQLQYLGFMPKEAIVLFICFVTAMLTEVASNTATASVLLPVLKDLSLAIGVNPIYLMLPAAVCCAYAFMLPVATPGNAIVLTAAGLKTHEMMRAGFVMNVLCVVIVTFMINTLGVVLFDVDTFPEERAAEEEEERRYQQWLKEREEKITAIQQALKHQGPKVHIPPNKNKKNKPPWPASSSSGVRRNSGMSETSSELDSAVDSPDIHESLENSGQEGSTQEPEPKPTPTSPLLSSLLSKSPILPGSSTSPLSQGRVMRPGYSNVSLALQNLVTSAISGTDTATKSSASPGSGSSTLSRLLDLPPSAPGGPLPRLSDLPTSSYSVKDSVSREKLLSPIKQDKDTKSCSQDGKSSGCGSSVEIVTDIKQEKSSCRPSMEVVEKDDGSEGVGKGGGVGGVEEKEGNCEVKEESKAEEEEIFKEEKPSKNGSESSETDCKEEKFHQPSFEEGANTEIAKKDCENSENFVTASIQSTGSDEKIVRIAKDRDMKKREEKRKDPLKEKKLEPLLKEESESDLMNREEDNSESRDKTDDDDDEKKVKVIKDSKLYKELESKSKKPEKSEKKEVDDFEQDNMESKDWMSEEDGNFPRSGKRKISGADYHEYSPQICESGPTSPASTHYGDDMDSERSYKSWKKPIMILWNEIAAHRFASIFLRPITDEQAPGYHSVVYRPMDLQTIKRNIESGNIRNTAEFQRDMMLMFLNAIMYNTSDHNVHQMAHQMMQDTIATIEAFLNTQMLARAEETPQKSLRRETRESSAKRSDDDLKRKRDHPDDKSSKKRR